MRAEQESRADFALQMKLGAAFLVPGAAIGLIALATDSIGWGIFAGLLLLIAAGYIIGGIFQRLTEDLFTPPG